ncbi:MAG: hypothetical protein NZ839_02520, partial [Endomicrobia bacterium]|nr:hypothetical protein [Endomicrobiia bacterium]
NQNIYFIFGEKIQTNKITIYNAPKSSFFTPISPFGTKLFIEFRKNGQWIPSNWEYFDLDGANEGKVNRTNINQPYEIKNGILSIYSRDFDEIEGIRITAKDFTHYITEIKITKLYKFNPINLRINETSTIDDEYTGFSGQVSFCDYNFHIKNIVEINDKVYIQIIDEDKQKEINFLYVNKIYYDLPERILMINFTSEMNLLRNKYISTKISEEFNIEAEKVVEMLLLLANIHKDMFVVNLYEIIDYIPHYDTIFNELFDVLKTLGMLKIYNYNKKLYIQAQAKTTPIFLSQGIENRVIQQTIYGYTLHGLPVIKIPETMKDFYEIVFPIVGNYYFREKEQNFYYVCFLPNTLYHIDTDVLYLFTNPENLFDCYASYFVLFVDEIENINQNSKVEIKYKVFGRKNYRDLDMILDINIPYAVPIIIDVCLFIYQTRYADFELYYARVRVYNRNTMEKLQEKYFRKSFDDKIVDPMRTKIEFKFLNINLAKCSQYAYSLGGYNEIVYKFQTPNVYAYYISFENEGALYKATKSNNDTKLQLVKNGRIYSVPGENLEVYYFQNPRDWILDYQSFYDNLEEIVVRVRNLQVREKVYISYFVNETSDMIQEILEISPPKKLVYQIAQEYEGNNILVNRMNISKYTYQYITKEVIKENFTLFERDKYSKTFYTKTKQKINLWKIKITRETNTQEIPITNIPQFYETIIDSFFVKIKMIWDKLSVLIEFENLEDVKKNIEYSVEAEILEEINKNIFTYNDFDSQKKYGIFEKTIDNKKIITEKQIDKIVKKYTNFFNKPVELVSENINLELNIDIDFSKFLKIYDEILQRKYILKIFEYEHMIDNQNNLFETIIKAKIIDFTDYRTKINHYGNKDFWGDNPPKYFGGKYYGY